MSADEALARIATYAAGNPDLEWIVGGGWWMAHYAGGTPTREALDAVVPDRPVFLTNKDGHGTWVNSRALELAGIDASTPDPADGRIERRPDGSPSGTLHEGAGTAGRPPAARCHRTSSRSAGLLTRPGDAVLPRDHVVAGRGGRGALRA